jgi:hypothetical protein
MNKIIGTLLSFTICLTSCKCQLKENSFDNRTQNLIEKIDSLGVEYIKYLRSDKSIRNSDTCYLNVVERDWHRKDEIAFDFYLYSRPVSGDKIPVHFKILETRGSLDVIFLYAHSISSDSTSTLVALRDAKLLANDPFDSNSINDFLYWTGVFSKEDPSYFKVIRSDSTLILNKYDAH